MAHQQAAVRHCAAYIQPVLGSGSGNVGLVGSRERGGRQGERRRAYGYHRCPSSSPSSGRDRPLGSGGRGGWRQGGLVVCRAL